MRVLIDLTSLADNFSGIERFALSITKELVEDKTKPDIKYILVFKNKIHEEFIVEKNNVECVVLKGKNKLLFNQVILPVKLLGINADYYFFPAFPAPFFFFHKKAINAIHDLGCWDCPSKNKRYMTFYFKIMYWKAALGNKKVVTVSNFSKERIIKILKKNPKEIEVVYDGLSDCFTKFVYNETDEQQAKKEYALPEKYILCLSTLEPRKNMRLLVEAYNSLIKENKIDVDLVLAGRRGWLIDDLLSNLEKNVIDRIHFTGFIEDDLLPYVYRKATAFVFPSIYEGFGVPPIEAMSMGVPVISSDAASLPEVLGNAALYFENENRVQLEEQILRVFDFSEKELQHRKEMGIIQAKKFDWKTEALKLRDTLFV